MTSESFWRLTAALTSCEDSVAWEFLNSEPNCLFLKPSASLGICLNAFSLRVRQAISVVNFARKWVGNSCPSWLYLCRERDFPQRHTRCYRWPNQKIEFCERLSLAFRDAWLQSWHVPDSHRTSASDWCAYLLDLQVRIPIEKVSKQRGILSKLRFSALTAKKQQQQNKTKKQKNNEA